MIENPHDREESFGSRRARQGNRMQFDSLDDIRAFCRDLPGGDARAADAATLRQQDLTKPPGSLGRLEELAIWLARWQGREIPRLERVTIAVFAGNHGVAARGVSAYPQAVTEQMVANFAGRRRGDQPDRQAGRRRAARGADRARSPDPRFHGRAGDGRRRVSCALSTSDIEPCRRTAICSRSARWASPTPRRRRRCARHCLAARALGRPRHRRRRCRAGAQARGDRGGARFSSRHIGRSAWRGGGAGRARTRRDRGRGAGGAAPSEFPCCSTASSRPRPSFR